MKREMKLFIVMVTLGIVAFFYSSSAWAAVAANTRIVNQASLTYDGGTGSQTITAGVTVTVALVPGIPALNEPADDSTPYTGANTPLSVIYRITANGNGPDTYTIAGAVNTSTNTTGASVNAPASVNLGATITTTGSTATVLQVPSDGTADESVNGIEAGNTVVVNGEARLVASISDPAAGIASITLGSALSAAPGAGVPVFERQDVTVLIYSGTISVAGTDITVTADITAANAAGSDTDQVMATYTSGTAAFVKYVRNISWASGNTGGTGAANFSTNGTSYVYYTGGVTGRPGDILEYVLVGSNNGAADVTGCTITDVLPIDFVSFHSNSWASTADVLYVDETGTEKQLFEEADSDEATLAGDTLTVNVGSGANASTGGTIPAGVAVRVTYQVTINP